MSPGFVMPPPMSTPSPYPPAPSPYSAYPPPPYNAPRKPGFFFDSTPATQQHYHHHHHHHHHSSPERPTIGQSNSAPAASTYATANYTQSYPAKLTKPKKKVKYQLQGESDGEMEPAFQYSRCTGKKRALCIGINYTGQDHELKGCINDTRNVRKALIRQFNYPRDSIIVLSDDASHPNNLPTRKNILSAMRWLVKGAEPHDSLFFHYSGHGGQTPDKDGDEIDGFDEVIYPLDYKKSGHISDDEMHSIMVKNLPTGCRLTALFDSCHSGTVLDLPYIYSNNGRLKGVYVTRHTLKAKETTADVISWSGCKDNQKSADTFAGGVAVGAMSYAFMSSLRANKDQSYQELLKDVRKRLIAYDNQTPQLGSSHRIDTNLKFVM